MNKQIPKPKKLCNKKAKEWLCDLYGRNLPERESEEAMFNLVNYFKTLKEIVQRQIAVDTANRTRQT